MRKLTYGAIALALACSSALAQTPAPLNKFAQACALWTDSSPTDEPVTYTVAEWRQRHRTIYMLFSEKPRVLVECHFRDLRDEVPEIESLLVDGDEADDWDVHKHNERIWLRYFPDPASL